MSRPAKLPPEIQESAARMDQAARRLIKDLMAMEGISQKTFAERTGRSQSALSNLLNDRRPQGMKGSLTLRTYASLLWHLGYEVGESMLEIRRRE